MQFSAIDPNVRCRDVHSLTVLRRSLRRQCWASRSASVSPEALKAIGAAFDTAWAEVAGNYGNDLVDVEKARLRLAKALLSVANEDNRDVVVLKRAALQRMALDYRRRG